MDIFLPSRKRKERIRSWGFECACALCQGLKNETVAVSLPSEYFQKKIENVFYSPFPPPLNVADGAYIQ